MIKILGSIFFKKGIKLDNRFMYFTDIMKEYEDKWHRRFNIIANAAMMF